MPEHQTQVREVSSQVGCRTASWAEKGEASSPTCFHCARWSQQTGPPARREAQCHVTWQVQGDMECPGWGEPVPAAGPRAGVCENDRDNFLNTI